jgi:hypothetical protein
MSHPADAPAVHNAIVLIPARTFIVYRGSRQTEYKLDNQCADGRSHCWSQAAIGLASPDDDSFGDAGIAQETTGTAQSRVQTRRRDLARSVLALNSADWYLFSLLQRFSSISRLLYWRC